MRFAIQWRADRPSSLRLELEKNGNDFHNFRDNEDQKYVKVEN